MAEQRRAGSRTHLVKNRLTEAARTRFLDVLAATSHVVMAAEAAGMSPQGAYHIRRRDPAFAAQWRAALLTGYDRIEAALIRRALGESHDPLLAAPDTVGTGQLDVDLAILLLSRHRVAAKDGARENEAHLFRADRDAAEKTLLAKLKAYERRVQYRAET